MLGPGFTAVVSALLDMLQARGAAPERFGVVGHSAGGSLAIAAAAADARIRACCSNGGSPEPRLGAARFPRVLQRIGRMLGHASTDEEVFTFFDALDLPRAARHMHARLLCLHGGQDALVMTEEMQRLVAWRGAADSTLVVWPEGVHCLYNHSVERNSVLATWFARELSRGGSTHLPSTEKLP
jgi:pimeloyl-ACP methyl ester carboxylesterase